MSDNEVDSPHLRRDILCVEEGDKVEVSWRDDIRMSIDEVTWDERDFDRTIVLSGRRGEYTLEFDAEEMSYTLSSASRSKTTEVLNITNRKTFPVTHENEHQVVYFDEDDVELARKAMEWRVTHYLTSLNAMRTDSHTEMVQKAAQMEVFFTDNETVEVKGAEPLSTVRRVLKQFKNQGSYSSDRDEWYTGEWTWDNELIDDLTTRCFNAVKKPMILAESVTVRPGDGEKQCEGIMNEHGQRSRSRDEEYTIRCPNAAEFVKESEITENRTRQSGFCHDCAEELLGRDTFERYKPIMNSGLTEVKRDYAARELEDMLSRARSSGHPLEIVDNLRSLADSIESDDPKQVEEPEG